MLTLRREEFIPAHYPDHAYEEIPPPLPDKRATISCPHSYPVFYEPLGSEQRHRFLEDRYAAPMRTSRSRLRGLARTISPQRPLVVARRRRRLAIPRTVWIPYSRERCPSVSTAMARSCFPSFSQAT
jgi:hypothetical protein